uniref:Uncharacterized protein n=1 Tax=Populus trichocarpa TaxID=3694 RepID=A0A3N7FDH9_POPTR
MSSADQPDDEKTVMEEDNSVDPINKPKQEEESEAEEDPEEDPEECEEMDDPEEYEQMDDSGHDSSNEKKDEGKTSGDAEHEPRAGDERDKTEEAIEDKTDLKDAGTKPKSVADLSEKKDDKVETEERAVWEGGCD